MVAPARVVVSFHPPRREASTWSWQERPRWRSLAPASVAPLAAGEPPPLCGAASADLVHHWAGEGTAEDSAGAADGTVSGATYVTGRIGTAFNFDGVDDQISFGNTVGNFGTGDFTVSYWIRTTAAPRRRA